MSDSEYSEQHKVLSFTSSNYNRFYMQLANLLPSNLSVMLLSNIGLRTFFGIRIPVIRAMFNIVCKKNRVKVRHSLYYTCYTITAPRYIVFKTNFCFFIH